MPNPQDASAHAGAPPPCLCPCQKPQLNQTVAGRYSGCATCLCGDGDGDGSIGESGNITQPSSGMDELRERVNAVRIDIHAPVQFCRCCEQHAEQLASRTGGTSQGPSRPASVMGPHGPCGPWTMGPTGSFIIGVQDWESSADGRFSWKVSIELRYNDTRCPSVVTQPPTTSSGLLSPRNRPVDRDRPYPGTTCDCMGHWMDASFRDGHYACGCPVQGSTPSTTPLEDLMNATPPHSAYPLHIPDDDLR